MPERVNAPAAVLRAGARWLLGGCERCYAPARVGATRLRTVLRARGPARKMVRAPTAAEACPCAGDGNRRRGARDKVPRIDRAPVHQTPSLSIGGSPNAGRSRVAQGTQRI